MAEHPKEHIDPKIHRSLQEICLDYPEAIEVEAFGAPSFEIRKKKFAMMHHHDDATAVWCKGAPGAQQAYINSEPERYYKPPYLGSKGWIGVRLDPSAKPDWPEIRDIIDQSYRLIAPKRVVAQLDSKDESTS